MNSVQKGIKYLAMAFAIFLSVSIIGWIITGLAGVSGLLSGGNEEAAGEMQVYPVEGGVSSLSIRLSGAELLIKTSDQFSVESNHDFISVRSENGRLCIDETKKPFFIYPGGVTVILNIPEDFIFDDATIEAGAGTVGIDDLSADHVNLSLGAGEVKIHHLTANARAGIEGGAGQLTIDGGLLCNLDLNMGVGKLTMNSRIEGQSSIDCGIGEANLTLLGSRDEYQIEIDKGIGEAELQGVGMRDDSVYGAGKNHIEIDGGIGDICVDFSEE